MSSTKEPGAGANTEADTLNGAGSVALSHQDMSSSGSGGAMGIFDTERL